MVDPKPRSPFLPGQPTTVELFVGRKQQIDHLLTRGVGQTALGKPTAFFVEGEYGIGKSSLANYCAQASEQEYGLFAITASLAGQRELRGAIEAILKSLISAAHRNRKLWQQVGEKMKRLIKSVELFGVEFDLREVAEESRRLTDVSGFLDVLHGIASKLPERDACGPGIFLVLDEINGIASVPEFAHFLKGLVDRNALAKAKVPLCIVLCGTPERRRELIACHEPVGRIFDVIQVEPLSAEESRLFFERAFASVGMTIDHDAVASLVKFGNGQPRILHMLGEHAFWLDKDGNVDANDVQPAVTAALRELTQKYIEPKVLAELQSPDYRSILKKIASIDPVAPVFSRSAIAEGLNDREKRKLGNFLQRMKKLQVIRPGEQKGEWVFNTPMVRMAIWLMAVSEHG